MRKIFVYFLVIGVLLQISMKPAFAANFFEFNFFDFFNNLISPKQQEQKKDNQNLPDLTIFKPNEVYMETDSEGKKIRFSTTTVNIGNGSLKLIGKSNTNKNTTNATQVIRENNEEKEVEIGDFVFHPGHTHWHIEKFTEFQLWSINKNGDLDKKIASTDKMSFCLWDKEPYKIEMENFKEEREFSGDCSKETQGISPGWSDTYSASLAGQELLIEDVKDGAYAIRATINPDKKIKESNYENNETTSYIEISGDNVALKEKP